MSGLAAGKTAIAEVTSFDVRGFPCTVAASVRDPPEGDGDRRVRLALAAGAEAWSSSTVSAEPQRVGVFVGAESGRGSWKTILALTRAAGGSGTFDHRRFGTQAVALAEQIGASRVSPAAVASALARQIGARGPVQTVSLACASGSAAIVEAARAIRLGACDVALCGGVGADVDPLMLSAFGLLGVLSSRGVSRPFDVRRDGFVVGEGAAMIVLSAERGSSTVEIGGVGRSLDANHLTAPDADGGGAARAMAAALRDAGARGVDYVQAHGTSTPTGDPVEAAALRRVLGSEAGSVPVSSVKGALGHWIAGAGALGFLCATEAVLSGTVLPTAGLQEPDATCDLPHVIGGAIRREVSSALVNSFAFGGANSCIFVRRAA